MKQTLRILGTRGVPARHGGFETFVERLAPFLASRGWDVVVYCQEKGSGPITEDVWQGVRRILVPVPGDGARAAIRFDWECIRHAGRSRELCLTLGYNTAVFCALLRLAGIANIMNMDGIEWSRTKYGTVARAWLYMNERMGLWLSSHLIADHPEIHRYLSGRTPSNRVTMIPYGADSVSDAPVEPVEGLALTPGGFVTLIARPEQENSVLEIVRGFSRRRRGCKLVVLGAYNRDNAYHRAVLDSASPEVRFVGAIYDRAVLHSLRFHSLLYAHGHRVGGTNPSLVEALGAGNAVLAHDNPFNRWVAGPAARYFDSEQSCSAQFDELLCDPTLCYEMSVEARKQYRQRFSWDRILAEYETLLLQHLPSEEYAFNRTEVVGDPDRFAL